MNLVLPAATDAIIAANRLIHPDAILRKLRMLSLVGAIRERNGIWEPVPRPKDEPWDAPVNAKLKSEKRLIQCKTCGKDTYHESYCCVACKTIGLRKPRRNCPICGATVNKRCNTYCSKQCRDRSQIGNRLMMVGGKRRMVNAGVSK